MKSNYYWLGYIAYEYWALPELTPLGVEPSEFRRLTYANITTARLKFGRLQKPFVDRPPIAIPNYLHIMLETGLKYITPANFIAHVFEYHDTSLQDIDVRCNREDITPLFRAVELYIQATKPTTKGPYRYIPPPHLTPDQLLNCITTLITLGADPLSRNTPFSLTPLYQATVHFHRTSSTTLLSALLSSSPSALSTWTSKRLPPVLFSPSDLPTWTNKRLPPGPVLFSPIESRVPPPFRPLLRTLLSTTPPLDLLIRALKTYSLGIRPSSCIYLITNLHFSHAIDIHAPLSSLPGTPSLFDLALDHYRAHGRPALPLLYALFGKRIHRKYSTLGAGYGEYIEYRIYVELCRTGGETVPTGGWRKGALESGVGEWMREREREKRGCWREFVDEWEKEREEGGFV